jgi:hypothetical protein
MKRDAIASLITVGMILNFGPAGAAPISYDLPAETAAFTPGPSLDVVKKNCTGCHSADYIATQPRGPEFKQNFWKAEVNKMIQTYGAPIPETDVDRIVEYLAATY